MVSGTATRRGRGKDITAFLAAADLDAFKAKVRAARAMSGADIHALRVEEYAKVGVTRDADGNLPQFVDYALAQRVDAALPWSSRDLGSKVLSYVMESPDGSPVCNNSWEFAKDSLFCEWAYVVDLDADTLEVYRGFQEAPHTDGRWASEEPAKGYFPCRLVRTLPLAGLTDAWIAEMIDG